jgi:hypothetical protein
MAADSGVVLPRRGFHEDIAAIVIGVALVALALAIGWSGRPTEDAASRKAFPKGWPNRLAATIDKPQTWSDAPKQALVIVDKKDPSKVKPVAIPILLGMAWVVGILAAGTLLRGQSVAAVLPGACLLALLGGLAYLMAAQKVINYYNLEYPLLSDLQYWAI